MKSLPRRAENSIVKIPLGRYATLLVLALLVSASKPARSILPPAGEHWSDTRLGFAFDLPEGWHADTLDGGVTLVSHRDEALFAFAVDVEDWPLRLKEPLANPADTLVSYVTQQFATTCDFVGSDVERYPDRLQSIQHDRPRRGVEVVEFTVGVLQEPSGDMDLENSHPYEEAPPDSGSDASPDGEPNANPDRGPDARPNGEPNANPDRAPDAGEEVAVHDSTKAGTRRFVVGPSFLVDLSKPGWPLRVWVLPNCSDPTTNETVEAEHAVVKSLRRL